MVPKWYPNVPRMVPGWIPDGPRMDPGWTPDGPRMVPGWTPDGPRMPPGWTPRWVEDIRLSWSPSLDVKPFFFTFGFSYDFGDRGTVIKVDLELNDYKDPWSTLGCFVLGFWWFWGVNFIFEMQNRKHRRRAMIVMSGT